MKKKISKEDGIVITKNKKQWRLYQQIGNYIGELDRLAEAQEVRKNPLRSVPVEMLPMVF